MKKALLVTHVSGFVPQFEMNNVHILQDMGYEVHYASNFHNPSYGDDNSRLEGTGIVCHQVDFERSPFKRDNVKAYRQLKKLMTEESFQLVHCHTPMGGALARMAAHATRTGPVIYTAHGFHFFKGAPLLNWLVYYPVERFLSRWTDMLITINGEDYRRAQGFRARHVRHIHGVGIQTAENPMDNQERRQVREELGIPENSILMVSAGELNKNKNQVMVLKAMALMKRQDIYYIACGKGPWKEKLEKFAKERQLEQQVMLPGYRKDLKQILQSADIFVMSSRREGMPTVMMEAMVCGLPVIGTDIRGNNELVEEGVSGYLVPYADENYMAKKIRMLMDHSELRERMGTEGKKRIKQYSINVVKAEMIDNYKTVLNKEFR